MTVRRDHKQGVDERDPPAPAPREADAPTSYPCWVHNSEQDLSVVVQSVEGFTALTGPGTWTTTAYPEVLPPALTALLPGTAIVGDADFTLRVLGTGFDAHSILVFAGHEEPTTLVSDTEVTTGVNMAVWLGADPDIPVLVRNGLLESNVLPFVLQAPTAASRRRRAGGSN